MADQLKLDIVTITFHTNFSFFGHSVKLLVKLLAVYYLHLVASVINPITVVTFAHLPTNSALTHNPHCFGVS